MLSVFLTAELVLFALYVQALPALTLSFAGTLGVFGFTLTAVSWYALKRSNGYLEAYFRLARERSYPRDSAIFDVKIEGIPRTGLMLTMLHAAFFILWSLLTSYYLLALWLLAS